MLIHGFEPIETVTVKSVRHGFYEMIRIICNYME